MSEIMSGAGGRAAASTGSGVAVGSDQAVTITESRPGDLLAALHRSADAEREYLFASREAGPDDLILVAWHGGEAVGYIAVSGESSGGSSVWEHVVVPDHRARGIGRRLLLEAVRRTPPGAVVEIDPMAELDQQRVVDYYGRLGFRRHAARGGLWATAAEVMANAATEQGRRSEIETPVSAIIDTEPGRVVTVGPAETVREAVARMNRHRIGAVVVSSDGARVEGIFAERDLVVGLDRDGPAVLGRSVAEVCTTDVVTCVTHDPVSVAMARMTEARIRHLPVTSVGRLVGIVSLGDVVARRLSVLGATTAPSPSER